MSIQRIPGQMLESNLTRSTDLAFQTNLLYLDVSNSRVGIRTAAPGNFALDVNGTARFQNSVEITGDLTVTGTTTVVNTTNMEIEDNILLLNSGGSVGNDAGIMIKRQTSGNNAAFYWDEGADKFKIVTTTSDGSTVTNIDDTAYTRLAGADPVDNQDFVTLQSMNNAISVATSALNMTFVGDDSTGSTLSVNETLKIAGASNISTAVSGDTLTITGPDLSSYITNSPITVVGDDSTGTTLNTGETIKIAGSNNISTAVSGDTVTITGSKDINVNSISSTDSSAVQFNDDLNASGTITAASFVTHGTSGNITGVNNIEVNQISSNDSSAIQINDGVNIAGVLSVSGNVISNVSDPVADQDAATKNYVDSKVNASNTLTIADDTSTTSAINLDNTLQVVGGNTISTSIAGSTLTITGPDLGTFSFSGNKITQTASNADFQMETAGTGNFVLSSTAGLILPKGTTAQRPTGQAGAIRFNNETSKYEVCLDGSTWTALKTEATSKTVLKDVFTGDGSTQTFISANVTTAPENLIVYIDSVMQEPDLNYITDGSTSSITITDEAPHIGARIVVISGFADDLI